MKYLVIFNFYKHIKISCFTCTFDKIVHGGWGHFLNWSSWSFCAASYGHSCIGEQVKRRKRYCNNPRPKNGGRHCFGFGVQVLSRSCLLHGNGGWSSWTHWRSVSPCFGGCGKGFNVVIRERSCTNPTPRCGGKPCSGMSTQYKMKTCYSKMCRDRGKALLSNVKSAKKL